MLAFDFMRHAFLGCFLISLIAGPAGWLLVLRRQIFMAHALPHIGFSGAAAAVLFGFSPLLGMIMVTLLGGMLMAWEDHGVRATFRFLQRETMTGLVLASSMGIGLFCLSLANGSTNRATSLLFGDVLGIDTQSLLLLTAIGVISLFLLIILWRPLLFASLVPEMAAARGVRMRLVSIGFMVFAALSSSACSVISGALLSFSLMVGPASVALKLELPPFKGMITSILLALILSWGGLALSWWTDAPVAFWISLGAILFYGVVSLFKKISI